MLMKISRRQLVICVCHRKCGSGYRGDPLGKGTWARREEMGRQDFEESCIQRGSGEGTRKNQREGPEERNVPPGS